MAYLLLLLENILTFLRHIVNTISTPTILSQREG
nr:MAG TPA: WPP domain protein [Caudoviricetes sp.]